MANPTAYPMRGAERTVVALFIGVAIGATGAPTLTFGNEILSVVRTGVGAYTITFREGWERIVGFVPPTVWGATHTAAAGLQSQILTIANTSFPPVMTVQFYDEAATSAAAEITNGNNFSMTIFAQQSKP